MQYSRTATILIAATIGISLFCATACEKLRNVPPLSDAEIQELTVDQPQIFVEKEGSLSLEGIENLYLGQPEDEAMEVLEEYCGRRIKTFDGGWRHSDAVFKGCIVEDGNQIKTLRAGFWPFNDNRVSTLEIKSRSIPQDVVRARFTELSDELTGDLPRRGILTMASTDYRLIASWDEGVDEPAHITIGFHPPD